MSCFHSAWREIAKEEPVRFLQRKDPTPAVRTRWPARFLSALLSAALFFNPSALIAYDSGEDSSMESMSEADFLFSQKDLDEAVEYETETGSSAANENEDLHLFSLDTQSSAAPKAQTTSINPDTIRWSDYTVKSIQPDNATVNLFDYSTGKFYDAAHTDDRMPLSTPAGSSFRSADDPWQGGINTGHLILFGDMMAGSGYWNIGSGAGRAWGKTNTNIKGIVERTLGTDGYPVISLDHGAKTLGEYDYAGYQQNRPASVNESLPAQWWLWGVRYAASRITMTAAMEDAPALSDEVLEKAGYQRAADGSLEAKEGENPSPSLSYLFNLENIESDSADASVPSKKAYANVRNLFQLDDDGYYFYDARKNFASFEPSAPNAQMQTESTQADSRESDGEFVLYNGPAVWRTDAGYECADGSIACADGTFSGDPSLGNFFPFDAPSKVFDEIIPSADSVKPGTLTSSSAITNTGNAVKADHHLGMTVEIEFAQPINGLVNRGSNASQPMIFEFSGDDDVYVFIDDVLVLDIGGIHSELYGTIDFSDGKVEVGQSWRTNGDIERASRTDGLPKDSSTLKEQFEATLPKDDARLKDSLWNGDTFSSNSHHTLKMFYLERGNYDSSLKLRFNLQTPTPHEIIKVDQNGDTLQGASFALYPAEICQAGDENAIECTNVVGSTGSESARSALYVRESAGQQALAKLSSDENGSASFMEADPEDPEGSRPFNFADRYHEQTGRFYILRETQTPPGYRSLPQDIVLEYNPETTMLTVANRWATGAHASFTSTITGNRSICFLDASGADKEALSVEMQKNGLLVAVPAILEDPAASVETWRGVYGTNLIGFRAVDDSDERESLIKAALAQAYLTLNQAGDSPIAQQWYLHWNDTDDRLEGVLRNLPGSADRYALLNNRDADLKMNYVFFSPDIFSQTGEQQTDSLDAPAKYRWLGEQVASALQTDDPDRTQLEQAVDSIYASLLERDPNRMQHPLVDSSDFSRTFRSLIYIPNEQRSLRVQKINANGQALEGAEFGLYDREGSLISSGTTDTQGVLVFAPRLPQDAKTEENETPGYARMIWADSSDRPQYILREIRAPEGYTINSTQIPVVVGQYGIYADAGQANDGVQVMAGVGKLTQTMVKFASDDEVNSTLRDVTAIAQRKPSGQFDEDWQDEMLSQTGSSQIPRAMCLHYGVNATIDYGLHDEDGGLSTHPFFISDTGYIRTRVEQTPQDSEHSLTQQYPSAHPSASSKQQDLGGLSLTSLFDLTNTVVVTDQQTNPAVPSPYGELELSKTVIHADSRAPLDEEDANRLFAFTIQFFDENLRPLSGTFTYYGSDKNGTVTNNGTIRLHHDESVTIAGLPAGTQYIVSESGESGWNCMPQTHEYAGTIEGGKVSVAHFINSEDEITTGALTVTKLLEFSQTADETSDLSQSIDSNQKFEITVTLHPDGEAISGIYGEMEFENSVATLSLGVNESASAWHLPDGIEYTVTENDPQGCIVSYQGQTGTIAAGEHAYARVINRIPDPADPEVPDDPMDLFVRKRWVLDDGRRAAQSVRIELLCDGKAVETIVLSASNDWSHTFASLESTHEWSVREIDIPEGFTARIEHEQNSWTIINDDHPAVPASPSDPSTSSRPSDALSSQQPHDSLSSLQESSNSSSRSSLNLSSHKDSSSSKSGSSSPSTAAALSAKIWHIVFALCFLALLGALAMLKKNDRTEQ